MFIRQKPRVFVVLNESGPYTSDMLLKLGQEMHFHCRRIIALVSLEDLIFPLWKQTQEKNAHSPGGPVTAIEQSNFETLILPLD